MEGGTDPIFIWYQLFHEYNSGVIYQDNCLTWLQNCEHTFDATITDPPYSSGGLHIGARNQPSNIKYSQTEKLPEFLGDNKDQRAFKSWLTEIYSLIYAKTRCGGYMISFCDWRQLPIMTDILQWSGWLWRGIAVWTKPKHKSRPSKGGFWNSQEFIVWGVKGGVTESVCLPGWFLCEAPTDRRHVTEKPLELLEQLCRIVPPGSTVFDPFMGSGTTGVAALALGHNFVGVELDEYYFNVADERLKNVEAGCLMDAPMDQLDLFQTNT